MTAPRLMLVEFFPTALRRNEGAMLFPFLLGLAQQVGVEARWICFGGDPARRGSAGKLSEDARLFAAQHEQLQPTHVASGGPLPAPMAEYLAARTPAVAVITLPAIGDVRDERYAGLLEAEPEARRFVARCAWFLDWLGVAAPAWEGRYLVDDVPPSYRATMANEAARGTRAHITIAGGILCANRRRIRDNPVFRDVELPRPPPGLAAAHDNYVGCAFCGSDRVALSAPGGDLLRSIEGQFRAILDTGPRGRGQGVYEFYDIHAFWRIDEVFALLGRLQVPPAVFLFNPRVDDVLRSRDRIDRALPALAAAGHELRLLSMGLENFAPDENARFNKGISLAQIDELLALLEGWSRAWPGVFSPFKGGHEQVELGFILFTPWTTLEDLRLNLDQASARGFAAHGYWLHSTLLIRESMALYHLAKHDGGLLVDGFPDLGQLYGVYRNEGDASVLVPWRFRDARVADFFALVVRVCAADVEGADCAFFAADPLFASASRLYAAANAEQPTPPLAVARALLAVMEQGWTGQDREALLGAAVRLAVAQAARQRTAVVPHPTLEFAAVQRALRGRERWPAPLTDVMVRSVEDVALPGSRYVRLGIQVGGRALELELHAASSSAAAELRSRHFRLVSRPAAAAFTEHERACCARLLASFDSQLELLRRRRGAARRTPR